MMSSIKWDYILVRTEAGVLKIVRQEDIVFVQGGRSATLLQTTKEDFILSQPMIEVEKKLNDKIFIRVSKSNIVNLYHADKIMGRSIVFTVNDKEVQIEISRRIWRRIHSFLPIVGIRERVVKDRQNEVFQRIDRLQDDV